MRKGNFSGGLHELAVVCWHVASDTSLRPRSVGRITSTFSNLTNALPGRVLSCFTRQESSIEGIELGEHDDLWGCPEKAFWNRMKRPPKEPLPEGRVGQNGGWRANANGGLIDMPGTRLLLS
jgi:hypothetical protein